MRNSYNKKLKTNSNPSHLLVFAQKLGHHYQTQFVHVKVLQKQQIRLPH